MPQCTCCSLPFEISAEELSFLKRITPSFNSRRFEIPAPTHCPDCRLRRRMIWRNEFRLHRRKSDLSANPILTFFPPQSRCKVYSPAEWWSDSWEALTYGRDFDFKRRFFEQFEELLETVPLLGLSVIDNENSDYINCAGWCKNCYLIAGANYNEDCFYGNYINHSRNSVDCNFIDRCELCYECSDCTNCYNLRYSFNSHHCSDSVFLHNCRNCRNCFGCVNLVGKEFYLFNKKFSAAEYQAQVVKSAIGTRSGVHAAAALFEEHRLQFPYRFMLGEHNENISGSSIHHSKNAYSCFDVNEVEDCRHCIWLNKARDCMDVYSWGFSGELLYECIEAGGNSYQTLFSATTSNSRDVYYSYLTVNSHDIFGCVGVQRKEYCILNKQYSKSEYEDLASKIVEHMQHHGEWGEFFPMRLSRLPYNSTIAQDYFPLERAAAEALGAYWVEVEDRQASGEFAVPDNIDECDESICDKVLSCSSSNRAYRIAKPEFSFYKNNRIPVPDRCFIERHSHRVRRRTPRQLWSRECAQCREMLLSPYNPQRPEVIYCDRCYLQAIY